MTTYRAIVSITFDDEDLSKLASAIGVGCNERLDPTNALDGELDCMSLGTGWVEQLFIDGEPTITRVGGMSVVVSEHD